jgi:hypothetical protein
MHLKVRYDLVFRFLDLDQLAKLVALARFPFAIIFVCGQNTLPIFSGDLRVTAKIRIRIGFTTCRTLPTIVSSDCVRPSTGVRRRGHCFTSASTLCTGFITFRVKLTSSRCFNNSKRNNTSAGVCIRARMRLWGWRSPLRFVHRIQELLVFQQLVHQEHPRFLQPLDILGQTSMPQRRLWMT